jgi:hypothetical protein
MNPVVSVWKSLHPLLNRVNTGKMAYCVFKQVHPTSAALGARQDRIRGINVMETIFICI